MKKVFCVFVMMFIAVIAVIAQEPVDSTAVIPVDIVTGGTVLEFLKSNMWVLIFIGYSILEAWFGQTNWIKEGSVLAFIWNWIGRIIKKQIPSIKGKYMNDEQLKTVRGGK